MAQAEGPEASKSRKAKAYNDMANAHFSGKGRFTLLQYTTWHQSAHNVLLKEGEPVAETKKVDDFLRNITDPRLSTSKQIVDLNPNLKTNFTLCQLHIASALAAASAREKTQRSISGVGITPAA